MISELAILACAWGEPDITMAERLTVEAALACDPAADPDPYLVLSVVRISDCADIPQALSGLLAARACKESRWTWNAVGDPGNASVGLMQIQTSVSGGIDRRNPLLSAARILELVKLQLPKTARLCPESPQWRVSWVRAIRKPGGPRCDEEPGEYEVARRLFGIGFARGI